MSNPTNEWKALATRMAAQLKAMQAKGCECATCINCRAMLADFEAVKRKPDEFERLAKSNDIAWKAIRAAQVAFFEDGSNSVAASRMLTKLTDADRELEKL